MEKELLPLPNQMQFSLQTEDSLKYYCIFAGKLECRITKQVFKLLYSHFISTHCYYTSKEKPDMSLVSNNLLKTYNTISLIFLVQYLIFRKHTNLHVGLSMPPDIHNKIWKSLRIILLRIHSLKQFCKNLSNKILYLIHNFIYNYFTWLLGETIKNTSNLRTFHSISQGHLRVGSKSLKII